MVLKLESIHLVWGSDEILHFLFLLLNLVAFNLMIMWAHIFCVRVCVHACTGACAFVEAG